MMMPNSSLQRELWRARLDRFGADGDRTAGRKAAGEPRADRAGEAATLRVQVGHALISLGSRLSGERVERTPHAHHHTA